MRIACSALVVGMIAACGGGSSQIAIGPVPARSTTGPLAGPLCDFAGCRCKDSDADAGVPDGQYKRFEIKLGPSPYDLWATLPGRVLYKSSQVPTACFYVDLAPGEQPVTLRASNRDGTVAQIEVSELGTRTNSWYETFRFSCGYGGTCSLDQLADLKAEYAQVKRNLFDPCGTTKVKRIGWDHGTVPDLSHPSDLLVRFTLDIYKFDAWKLHGDPTCTERGGPPPAGYGNDGTGPAADAPAAPDPGSEPSAP